MLGNELNLVSAITSGPLLSGFLGIRVLEILRKVLCFRWGVERFM
jgi:hypothetical protein